MTSSPDITALAERENFITRLAETIGSKANAASVFGAPITCEGITIVPVARARWGLGGGGGQGSEQRALAQRGFGGGGGMVVKPVGYLAIRGQNVQYHEIQGAMRFLAAAMLGMLLGAILRRRRRA
jgi:uncharacterized spore protein YtfJ